MDEERTERILKKAERLVGSKRKNKPLEDRHMEMIEQAKRILESESDENFKINLGT